MNRRSSIDRRSTVDPWGFVPRSSGRSKRLSRERGERRRTRERSEWKSRGRGNIAPSSRRSVEILRWSSDAERDGRFVADAGHGDTERPS